MPHTKNNEILDTEDEIEPRQTRIEVSGQTQIFEEITPKKALRNLQTKLKEYIDYQTVPNRRKTDFSFREFFKSSLISFNDHVKEIHALLIGRQQMSTWATGDQIINDIVAFIREIERADYGFTTFFDNPKLLEIDISQLYIVDYEINETLINLHERTIAFKEMVKRNNFEDTDLWLETLNRLVGRLIKLNDDRGKLIGSYERISY